MFLKKIILYSSVLLIGIYVVIYAVRKYNYIKSKKIPESFKTIKPSSAINFLRFDTIPASLIKKAPGVSTHVIRIYKDSELVNGELSGMGVFSVIDSTQIQFKIQNQNFVIYSGAPRGMYLLKVNNGKGEIKSSFETSFRGANESFQLTSNKKLILGYLWRSGPDPIHFSPPGGISLQQSAINPLPTKNSITASEVFINTDQGPLNIKAGEIKKFTKGGVRYSAFVQTSIYHKISDIGEDATNGYILHAIVVQE